MTNSANSVFHITTSFNSLEGILMNKFYPSYCKELIYYENKKDYIIVPMIAFCDVPLSMIKNLKYGEYGIGLSKEWAKEKGLNPVLYIERNSILAKNFLKSMDGMFEPYKSLCILDEKIKALTQLFVKSNSVVGRKIIQEKISEIQKQKDNVADSLKFTLYSSYFTKHYQDDLNRNGEEIKSYTFYNEREWRFVPDFETAMCKLKITDDEYKIWRGDTITPKPLITEINLPFFGGDINYIIVNGKEEIKPMIKTIEKCIELGKLEEDKEILFTKIITYKQIVNDY